MTIDATNIQHVVLTNFAIEFDDIFTIDPVLLFKVPKEGVYIAIISITLLSNSTPADASESHAATSIRSPNRLEIEDYEHLC